ncbi:MAG: hypothetical protein JO250_17820 [Armatimonadetes bacterium]|nr:hypothetical protein [Armatimonadota bacterium]
MTQFSVGRRLVRTFFAALVLGGAAPLMADSVAVAADFAAPADYPLVKDKFGVYNSGVVPVAHYRRDAPLLDEVRPESLRIDLAWGTPWAGWAAPPVAGTAADPQYHFGEMDEIAALLSAHDVRPQWSYCYVPDPLQKRPGRYRDVPTDLPAWGHVLGVFARRYRASRPPLSHEIYNEPDNGDFFHGTEADYLEMYRQGARGIRAADPDAAIGGPALAFSDDWVDPFLDFVTRQRLPLDYFSFHFYPGVPYREPDIAGVLTSLRDRLDRHPELAATAMHLDEYNSYPIDYPPGGRQDRFGLASALLHDYRYFLSQPYLTEVNWAQFMDTGGGNWSGMVSRDGHRKAVFNAYSLYARMPVDRRRVSITGPDGVEGLASTDGHRASLALWNRSGQDRMLSVVLAHLPFARGRFQVFRIDAAHASWGDDPAQERLSPVEAHADVPTHDLAWSGPLPNEGVVFLEANDETGLSELTPNPVATVVRVLHYSPDRTKACYADFDRRTWIARLGMAQEQQGTAAVGVVAAGLPPALTVSTEMGGPLRRIDGDSLLGLRMDYEADGAYVKGILFHGPCQGGADLYAPRRPSPMPWGTHRPPERVVRVPDLARFQIAPADFAPRHWSGRVQITFLMRNAGPHARAKISLSR